MKIWPFCQNKPTETPCMPSILRELVTIRERIEAMSQELDDLTTQVTNNNTLVGSAITLIQGLKTALDAAGTDPTKLKALSDSLGAKDQELADAITANTPAAQPTATP